MRLQFLLLLLLLLLWMVIPKPAIDSANTSIVRVLPSRLELLRQLLQLEFSPVPLLLLARRHGVPSDLRRTGLPRPGGGPAASPM